MRKFGFSLLMGIALLICGCNRSREIAIVLDTPTSFPTYTPFPTYTALPTDLPLPTYTVPAVPTATPLPTAAETMIDSEINPTGDQLVYMTVTPFASATPLVPVAMEQEFPCGKSLGITVTFMIPKLQATLSEHFPIGRFLLMRVKLRSLTEAPIQPLQDPSFEIHGSLFGRDITILLDRANSDYANSRWDTPKLERQITADGYETFLVFDVNPEMSNYELFVQPVTKENTEAMCQLRLPLPIAYY